MHSANDTGCMRIICPLLLGKQEGYVFEISTKLDLAPLSLWGLLDLVTPMYALQQITPPLFDFPPCSQAFPVSGVTWISSLPTLLFSSPSSWPPLP